MAKRRARLMKLKPSPRRTRLLELEQGDKMPPVDVDAMLARWREIAGADWEAIFRNHIDILGRNFEGDSDPLDAWEVFLWARALGEAPPQWALDYFAITAARILDLRTESTQGKTVKPAMIARALGMVSDGAGTAFPDEKEFNWIAYAWGVRSAIQGGSYETLAIQDVADLHGVSASVVRKAWKRFQLDCPEFS